MCSNKSSWVVASLPGNALSKKVRKPTHLMKGYSCSFVCCSCLLSITQTKVFSVCCMQRVNVSPVVPAFTAACLTSPVLSVSASKFEHISTGCRSNNDRRKVNKLLSVQESKTLYTHFYLHAYLSTDICLPNVLENVKVKECD
jgi:hypothetical protein